MRIVLIALVAACGAKPAPAPAPVASRPAAPAPAPRPAPTTCGEAGVILRGEVVDQRAAGPAKEAAIARACLHDKWSVEVIDCIGAERRPSNCLERLSKDQHAALIDKLVAWNDSYPDESFEEPTDDSDPPPTCADGIGDVATYAPKITAAGDDRELAVGLREHALRELCEQGPWDVSVLSCLAEQDVETCRQLLAQDQQQALTDRLAELDKLAARAIATKRKPASFGCKQVVAVRYGDPAWKGKLDAALTGSERRKLIAESRAKLLKACTDDRWAANLRACVVSGGGDACFTATKMSALRWGYPAGLPVIKTGIAECDAYGASILALSQCSKIPADAAEHMLAAFTQASASWARVPTDQQPSVAAACKMGEQAIRQSASSLGCTI